MLLYHCNTIFAHIFFYGKNSGSFIQNVILYKLTSIN